MEKKFIQELFRINGIYNYVFTGKSELFAVEPTDECRDTLNSYGMDCVDLNEGCMVTIPCIYTEQPGQYGYRPDVSFSQGVKFTFAMFSADNEFYTKVSLPYDTPGEFIYYFNNLDYSQRRTNLLHRVTRVLESEKVKLNSTDITGRIENAQIPALKDCSNVLITSDYKLKVYNSAGIEVTAGSVQSDKVYTYVIDVSEKGEGLYTVTDSDGSRTMYCAKASFIRRRPVAVVEVYPLTTVDQRVRVLKVEENVTYIDPKKFRVHFGIDEPYWRYKIVPVNVPAFTIIKIKDAGGFTYLPEKARINSCQDPVLFTSEQSIEISDETADPKLYKTVYTPHCHWTINCWFYCDQNYGIWINGSFRCKKSETSNGQQTWPYECPTTYTDTLIGPLPSPEEIATSYYTENNKYIAEMTVYLVKNSGNNLEIRFTN